jgi:hypothetical protein
MSQSVPLGSAGPYRLDSIRVGPASRAGLLPVPLGSAGPYPSVFFARPSPGGKSFRLFRPYICKNFFVVS